MDESLTLQLPSVVGAIEPAGRRAEDWLRRRGLPSEALYLVKLALEELVTNCIKHGYDDGQEHTIDVVLSVSGKQLSILVVDDGRAFDASKVPPPDLSVAIEQRPIGGLGIHMLRELSDTMSYERRHGKNRLTLTKLFE